MAEEKQKINDYKDRICKELLTPLKENAVLQQRMHPEPDMRKRPDGEYQRDYTRILYSSSFRRLQSL